MSCHAQTAIHNKESSGPACQQHRGEKIQQDSELLQNSTAVLYSLLESSLLILWLAYLFFFFVHNEDKEMFVK